MVLIGIDPYSTHLIYLVAHWKYTK
jgi:hypothetical protein